MNFRIADTFTASLSKLTGDEQKQVKTTAFDLQMNPANSGMNFHKLEKSKDQNFWSVRVTRDIRLIVHKATNSLLLCYVDHHDKAYQWAERRKLETHPKTGAAQLVEIRETVQKILVPDYITGVVAAEPKPKLFAGVKDETLLSYGVPSEWLSDVLAADEDSLLQLADHLPSEAAEALLELATGGQPTLPVVAPEGVDPFEHPDAQRRFRVMSDADELARALDYPWDKWSVFLHPAQRQLVEKDYNGPARVSGSAGTGKTIVALHRAVYLTRQNQNARVLLTTFSDTLANALRVKLHCLISNEPRLAERLDVAAIEEVGKRLYGVHVGVPNVATRRQVEQAIAAHSAEVEGLRFSQRFMLGEWEDVVDAWQLQTLEDYLDVRRLGRKTRLPEAQREILWHVFSAVKLHLAREGLITSSQLFSELANKLSERKHPPYDVAVVDEAQDISVAQLRFLAALDKDRPNSLFFAGDLGQRIFQTPFSWKSLGVDIRGRSQSLRINYRTSHQIRQQADRLLGPEVTDVDGNLDDRRGTVSVFNGPSPTVRLFESEEGEIAAVASWLEALMSEGYSAHEIGIFVRSPAQVVRAKAAADASGLPYQVLDEKMETVTGMMTISTMHLAKGLEFRAVVVMACDDEVIPLQERIESVADNADLEEVYDTERHLLYVACTRARDRLLVTSVKPASEFLDDLSAEGNNLA
ncbi:UvrD-helicase domain-containing protein [Pseudomonas sp. gcc21]|uniref:3'-5' exonuclease n=1 Tax=Pseudomonas sp. gcc21 TaxID=2726989 RepID=UPI001451842C|nr:3'-5' exonuclease [Pseudomonas sp. gcc21]QJD58408.1 UvrD-helicase domain-containing protein [Pseudomonas sp. gcc21]